MATDDKGRRKWGGISQDSREDCRSEKGRLGGMRGGAGSRVPPRAIYTPGSGPLKKSGRTSEDFSREVNEETSRRVSVQDRLKPPQFNGSARPEPIEVEPRPDRFTNSRGNQRNTAGPPDHNPRPNQPPGDNNRRRGKKPEQLLYVPKKVQEALAERDVANRSPPPPLVPTPAAAPVAPVQPLMPPPLMPPPQHHHHLQQPNKAGWEAADAGNSDWDKQSNRSHRNDGPRGNRSGRQADNNGRCRVEDQGKRYSGNRRNRPPNENEEREWRSKSPMTARNYGNRRDFQREVRQGSEPLSDTPNNANEYNRTRDTRSVDPPGYAEKFQRKPPSGRRGGGHGGNSAKMLSSKIEALPPRLQRKYLAENGLDALPIHSGGISSYAKPNDDWDGSTVTFQGSSDYNNPPYMQNNWLPQSNWSNTIPARSRGRGRLRLEESETPMMMNYRPGTPDQYSAASSRSHTPSLEYMTRSYERRGSNSTMYTSMESLSRADTVPVVPPPLISPSMVSHSHSIAPMSLPTSASSHVYNHQGERANNNNNHSNNNKTVEAAAPTGNAQNQRYSSGKRSPDKNNIPCNSLPDLGSIADINWSEEVELSLANDNARINPESEPYPSRSSSVMSFRDNGSVSGRSGSTIGAAAPTSASAAAAAAATGAQRNRGYKKKRRDRRRSRAMDGDRSCSRDDVNRGSSRERVNNQHNRENDSSNNVEQKSVVNRRYEGGRRYRDGKVYRSRESSRDRDYRPGGGGRTNSDENWRTGKRSSVCDSDDSRTSRLLPARNVLQSHSNAPAFANSETNMPLNNCQPGVLILPERSQISPRNVTTPGGRDMNHQYTNPQSQQRKTLFDPNNPGKPIVVRPTGNRASALHLRDNDLSCQFPNATIACNSHGILPPQLGTQNTNFPNYHNPQIEPVGIGSSIVRQPPSFVAEQIQIQANSRPAWYDPCSDILRTAKDQDLLLEVETVDRKLQYLLSSGPLSANWDRIAEHRKTLQKALQTLLESDIKFCQSENVEQHFWKILYYNMIEMLRKMMPKENPEAREMSKKIMLRIIDEGTTYFEKLLVVLENKYKLKLEYFLAASIPPNGLGFIGLALVSAQKIYLFLGDLARYKEQANETTNYGKSRQWYLQAQQINPKHGRPYNQLALLATYARRKLDAVYYYMRSLMASNPFHSARESLIGLFDENRKKYESTERKRKEEREWKERARMKEKEGANNAPGALRRETWVHPGGRRVRRTTSSTTPTDAKFVHSDSEELAQLTSAEVNKRFITSYLHVHGKLITKIGMETFQEAAIQMLREFRTLLQHSPLPIAETRLLQLLALNMFAIDTTQLKDSQMQQGYRSEIQERALVVSLQMFDLILERGVALLKLQFEENKRHRLIVNEDMQVLLPAIKIWCDWMLCHSTVWNPPPSCTDYRVGPPGDSWSRLATMVNLLEMLSYSRQIVIQLKDVFGREDDVDLIKLPEDTTLSGFTPLMSNPQDPCYADKSEDMEVAQMCLRIQKILFFGEVFLCGLETPVLKLQKNECGLSEYVSVVEASGASSPSSPPEQSDSELLIESYSEDEEGSNSSIQRSSNASWSGNQSSTSAPTGEIRSLIERKEELERRQRKQERHRQQVQAILKKSIVAVDIEVRPRLLVPDTNCFIDYLPQLWSIARATSGTQPLYTLVIPLVVLSELEGLARGGGARDCPPASRAALNPEHVARVGESAKAALAFAKSQNPAIKCSTTRGNLLSSSTFTAEEDVTQDGHTRNDDRILATCLSLCRCNSKDTASNDESEPRRLKREVVLLTEDRNLRVKALARDVPVREVPDFIHWAGLG